MAAASYPRDCVQSQWPPRSPACTPVQVLRRPRKAPRKRAQSRSSTWPNAKHWSPACIDVLDRTLRSAIPTSNATPSNVSRSPKMVSCSRLFHPAPCSLSAAGPSQSFIARGRVARRSSIWQVSRVCGVQSAKGRPTCRRTIHSVLFAPSAATWSTWVPGPAATTAWQAERSMTRNIPTIGESRRSFIEDGRSADHFEGASSRRVRQAMPRNFLTDEQVRDRFTGPHTTAR